MLALVFVSALASCATSRQAPESSVFGEPLYVNGERITDAEIERMLIYSLGHERIEFDKIALLIEQEIETQARGLIASDWGAATGLLDAPRPPSSLDRLAAVKAQLRERYRVRDDELEAELARVVSEFQENYPTLEFETEMRRAHRTMGFQGEWVRQALSFERVFLPEDPDQWPTTTRQAVANADDSLLQYMKDRRQERLDLAAASGAKLARPDESDSWMLRGVVSAACSSLITFKMQTDGVDPSLVYWVDVDGDGRPEKTCSVAEMWPRVREAIDPNEIAQAKQWFVTSRATRDRLLQDHALLAPDELSKRVETLTREIADESLDHLARRLSFPSASSFVEYEGLRGSHEHMREAELQDEPGGEMAPLLQQHFDRANRRFGLAYVDAEVILVSAQDVAHLRWKEDGWKRARAAALDLRAALAAQQDAFEQQDTASSPTPYEFWSEMRTSHCDYWDMPLSMRMRGSSSLPRRDRGKFPRQLRDGLLEHMGESAYTEWITGECITDHVFFDQRVDTVDGPFRGPLGWYLTRVNGRQPPTRPLDPSNAEHRGYVKSDYLRWAFIQYSKQAVAEADVRGWNPPWGS